MSFDPQRISGPPPSMQKASASIDVIGSAVRDTRRQQLEFRESMEHDLYAATLLYFVLNLSVYTSQFHLN